MAALKWRAETVMLTLKDDDTRQPCVEALICGGLAVHRAFDVDGYAVTHVASGLRIAKLHTKQRARQFAEAILPLTNWAREEGFLTTRVGLDGRVKAEFERVLGFEDQIMNRVMK